MIGAIAAGVVAFALGIFVLWVLVYASGLVHPKVRTEAGVTGAAAMERKVLLATGLVIGTGLVLTVYGFFDPIRQANARERQENTSIGRGVESYATLCYPCHGIDGKGAVVPGSDPPRVTPQLNRPQFADSWKADPDEAKKEYDLVMKTITRGRPGTPMPAWGQSDGGTLNIEQILELATFITHGSKDIDGHTPWDEAKDLVDEHIAAGSPTPIPVSAAAPPLTGAAKQGRGVWEAKGCVGCHAIDGVGGQTGPEQTHMWTVAGTRKPGMSPEDYIKESILQPQAFVVQGYPPVMPSFQGNITDDEINAIIQYFQTLK